MTDSSTPIWAGEFSRYQWIQYLLLVMPAFTCSIHELSQVMVGATPKHKCLPLENETILNYVDSCHYISAETNKTRSCSNWEYDHSNYGSTIVSDWNMVCDRRWMGAVAQSVYMIGSLLAATVLGQMADRYGRWKILVPTEALQVVFAVACAFVDHYALYVVFRFIVAVSTSGSYIIGFVLALEMAPDRHRTMAGFVFQMFYALGITALAGWSYFIREWHLLQLIFGLHSALLLIHWWVVDESPRWLFAQGRLDEAAFIVSKQLITNGKSHLIPVQGFSQEQLCASLSISPVIADDNTLIEPNYGSIIEGIDDEAERVEPKKYGLFDLFRMPRLRTRTLIIILNWFATSLVYYGLSLNTGALVGEPHLMLFISGIVEVPAYLISAGITDRLGRRPVISFCLVGGGLVCIVTTFFPHSSVAWTTSMTCIVMMGKALISTSFAIVYNYTSELFPTVVRSTATGVGVTSSGIASTVTPLIFLLDSLDPKIPSVFFGVVAITAGFSSLFLPETRNCPLLNTLQEGEDFGKGDTGFAHLKKKRNNEEFTSSSQQNIVANTK